MIHQGAPVRVHGGAPRDADGLGRLFARTGLRRLFLAGLATDFCVAWSALDARAAGFEALAVEDSCRAIDASGSLARAWEAMATAGVGRLDGGAFSEARAP